MTSRMFRRPSMLGSAPPAARLTTTRADGPSHWWPRSGLEPIYAEVWATHRAQLIAGLRGTPVAPPADATEPTTTSGERDDADEGSDPGYVIGVVVQEES